MTPYIARRLLLMIPTLVVISVLSFMIIELPPGDYVTFATAKIVDYDTNLGPSPEDIVAMRQRWGLNQPLYVKYLKWLRNLLRGDLGVSMRFNAPVASLVLDRLPWSLLISLSSLVFVYAFAIPVGMFSATHQYSLRDYIFTAIGFVGLATPNFLIALIMLWLYFNATGDVILGLFSEEYLLSSWSLGKFIDLLKHLWIPLLIVGTAGTASMIRVVRNSMLDELQKPYYLVARAKGLPERRVLYKYPFRIAINPLVSTVGWTLPALVNGELLTSLVMGIPTLAPIFLGALLAQDMFLAGSIVLILSTLTVIGTLVSDILLVWLDPRIRDAV